MRILMTYAVQGEFTEVKFRGLVSETEEVEVGYMRTGIGKVKSAFLLADVIDAAKPDMVINMGTAGSETHKIGDIVVCDKFVDRDMAKLAEYGVESYIDMEDINSSKGYCKDWNISGTCNTGDTFVTDPSNLEGDVIDMEAYAQAVVCKAKRVPFVAVKYVTDIVGQNSLKAWEDKLSDARQALSTFFEERGGII